MSVGQRGSGRLGLEPLGRYVTVTLLPEPGLSEVLIVPSQDTATRWATVEAIGPLVSDLSPGDQVLVSVHQGTFFGGQLLLPSKSVLLTRERE